MRAVLLWVVGESQMCSVHQLQRTTRAAACSAKSREELWGTFPQEDEVIFRHILRGDFDI